MKKNLNNKFYKFYTLFLHILFDIIQIIEHSHKIIKLRSY